MTGGSNDEAGAQAGRRSYPSRAGITALNLIAPGLGLLRIGHWRAGGFFLAAPLALLVLTTFGMGNVPLIGFHSVLVALVIVFGLLAAIYGVSAIWTWRGSRFHSDPHGWSRWYGLTVIAIVVISLLQLAARLGHQFYKPFYAPAESMAPTIGKGDKFIADMRWRGPFKQGGVIIFERPDSVRVSRIAAVPGDRISMRGGVPFINGRAALRSPDGQADFVGYDGSHTAKMIIERLPGEGSTHRVLDVGPSEFDDMQEVFVPPGHLFVLGDNRDRSADSRVPAEMGGVGMVPVSAIMGRPMYIHWSSDRSKIGTRLDR